MRDDHAKLRRDDVRQAGTPFLLAGGPVIPLLAATVILLVLVNTPWDQIAEVTLLAIVASCNRNGPCWAFAKEMGNDIV